MLTANFPNLMKDEIERAILKFKPINSIHEAKAIIEEELDEFWNEVKKYPYANNQNLLQELIQIATMCWRAALDMELCE